MTSINATANNRTTTTARRVGTETKPAFKTTEFMMFVVAVAGVLIASLLVGSDSSLGDGFRADEAWTLVTVLTVGYMISRGLAKSGSRDLRNDND